LSPRIDAQLSQHTEGKFRDKAKTRTSNKDQTQKNDPKEIDDNETSTVNKSREEKRSNERHSDRIPDSDKFKKRLVPYVDLPPKRMTRLTEGVIEVVKLDPKEETTYKNRAPVEIGLDIEKLVDSVLDMEITIPLKSLAGVSGAIQKEIKRQVTKARVTIDEKSKIESEKVIHKIYIQDVPLVSQMIQQDISEEIPAGSVVARDLVLQFMSQNPETDIGCLKVGKVSESLRSIYARINKVGQEECLLDAGSQIVSINKKVAVQLGLVWDPSVRIDMESASGHIERTLGLARNVSFEVRGTKLFLQVHVLENPPYRVLLGKPFETLGSTVIQTYENGSLEVVVKDPNMKRVAVIPTYRRGETPEDLQKTKFQDF